MLISTVIQQACLLFLQAYSVPYEQSQANSTSVHDQPEDSGDEYDASSSSSSSQGPPGFSGTAKGSQVTSCCFLQIVKNFRHALRTIEQPVVLPYKGA